MDKHQIQGKFFNLSHFANISKCKFISLIYTRQKHKMIVFMFHLCFLSTAE